MAAKPATLPPLYIPNKFDLPRAMVFVDGENLAIRYGAMLEERGENPHSEVTYEKDVLVWRAAWGHMTQGRPAVVRKYFYTSVQGGSECIERVQRTLKGVGFETPRVFRKDKKLRSKKVDITLSTDMLLHAARKHYDIAVLITGDADFIPLIEAVQGEGARVLVWALSSGLSPALKIVADEMLSLDSYLFG
jgi:uncharacterized LabA/DUF88 family protein